MAKVPGFASVKTRLQPPLTDAEAQALASALLLDRLDAVAALAGVTPVLAFAPALAEAALRRLAPPVFRLLAQRGDGLGERLQHLFADLLAEHPVVMALDCDSPMVPMSWVGDGITMLRDATADVVLGPSEDGGYWSIGLCRPYPELFEAIPWSTADVLEATLARARRLGLRVRLLPAAFDVDTATDLRRLHAELSDTQESSRTAALVRGPLAGRLAS
jgi:uncharacterized protein